MQLATQAMIAIVFVICVAAWVLVEMLVSREKIRRNIRRNKPSARRAGDEDDSGAARRKLTTSDLMQYDIQTKEDQ